MSFFLSSSSSSFFFFGGGGGWWGGGWLLSKYFSVFVLHKSLVGFNHLTQSNKDFLIDREITIQPDV